MSEKEIEIEPEAREAFDKFSLERGLLEKLVLEQPQTLLLEGGTEKGRFYLALYWAMLHNCGNVDKNSHRQPCGECRICRQILSLDNTDVLIYDGRIANKQDEENPGLIRALTIANMRELKTTAAGAPRNLQKRVVIFQGMNQLREEALNSLLKTLEEPAQNTCFVLLTPQREQILPTLVSRSICITLRWQTGSRTVSELEEDFIDFLKRGSNFLDKISLKGALDLQKAEALLTACQNALLQSLKPENDLQQFRLAAFFRTIAKEKIFQIQLWINEAMDMLRAAVNPQRCLEAFSTKLYILVNS